MNINNLGDDDKLFALRISDLAKRCEQRVKPYFTDFLNERQAMLAHEVLEKPGAPDYKFWGGYDGAERVMLCVKPEFIRIENGDFPIACVNVKFRREDELTHRDFLGSLMALGIKREAVGDIVVQEGIASFFIKTELEQYVVSQIRRIGRVGVTFCEEYADFNAVQQYDERVCTVSSLRIDSIVGAALKLSRAKAQQLIKSGTVAKNFEITYNTDCKVASGDKISVRGYGKFIAEFDGSVSKKGKYRVLVRVLSRKL